MISTYHTRMKNPDNHDHGATNFIFKAIVALICTFWFAAPTVSAQSSSSSMTTDDNLIKQFIQARELSNCIVFDANNIKQFWPDKSVLKSDNQINVYLNPNKLKDKWVSEPLKIQLANVFETLDCKIDVITEEADTEFIVTNKESKVLSSSFLDQDFIQYHIFSSVFHLEDIPDFSFFLRFSSNKSKLLRIFKIVISFSDNKKSSYLGSPGFNALSEQIEKEGISIQNSAVKYIISWEHNKIFIRIPEEQIKSSSYCYYHVFPLDEKDLLPGREQYKFNNRDFDIVKSAKTIIYKPFNCDDKNIIIQVRFPVYKFASIKIGQSSSNNNPWKIEIKKSDLPANDK